MMKLHLGATILSTLAWTSSLSAKTAPAGMTAVWQSVVDSRAKIALVQLKKVDPSDRAGLLAKATASLDDQPVTDDALRNSEALLATLAEGNDTIAAEAAYLRARIYQVHFSQPDYSKAAALYEELATKHPDTYWAHLGLVKLAMLHLYLLPSPSEPAERVARAEQLLTRVSEKELQRDLHLQIGLGAIFWHLPLERVLPHLLAADHIGDVPGTAQEDLVVQIAELSLRAGQLGQSRQYFERYLREYSSNIRCYTVEQKLKEIAAIEAQQAKGKSS